MDVKLPPLGEGADSGTVISIHVNEGDQIEKGQTILELENEKAVAPIPSTASGKITKLHVKEGAKISVGQLLLSVEGAEKPGAKPAQAPPKKAASKKAPPPEPAAEEEEDTEIEPEAETDAETGEEGEEELAEGALPPAASPSLRRIARDVGIDLRNIRGSERGGRIVLADLRAYIARLQKSAAQPKPSAPAAAPAPAKAAAPEPVDFSKWGQIAKRPMNSLRKIISRRMADNWNTIPHVTQFDEFDITGLMELRKKHAPAYDAQDAKLTITSFALKAVAAALKKHPSFNASLDEAAEEIVWKEYYHIGLAVDTEQGLVVPVIRDVDRKNLLELSREVNELALKARDRKLGLEEMKGGTFTISNQGGIGGGHFTPIVNKPEVAILGLGRGAWKPVVREQRIEPRLMLPVTVSYDHRVIDGGEAARFIVSLAEAFAAIDETQVKL
jgi:pyruvate dehydrogenase E2 component (dihydrolipoamide acetyltransferase)